MGQFQIPDFKDFTKTSAPHAHDEDDDFCDGNGRDPHPYLWQQHTVEAMM